MDVLAFRKTDADAEEIYVLTGLNGEIGLCVRSHAAMESGRIFAHAMGADLEIADAKDRMRKKVYALDRYVLTYRNGRLGLNVREIAEEV